MHARTRRHGGLLAAVVTALMVLSACASTQATDASDASTTPAATEGETSETPTAGPRVAVAFEGGVAVLDGDTLEPLADFASEEFIRLNPAGDDRHVLVTVSDGFQVLDTAAGTTDEPTLTDMVFPAQTAAHVVSHHGQTILYDDGTSDTIIFATDDLAGADDLPETQTIPGVEVHHGVSIVLEDGAFLTTVGNADGRTGIRVEDADGETIAESDECPGVHGEGTLADETVVLGCEDGALLYHDGEIVKLDAPDDFGRMGNAYVDEHSPLVIGDYRDDPDAEGYLLHRIALIDAEARTLEVVDLPEGVEYTWRGIARGPDGLAYLLASDGSLHVLDPETGEVTASWPVIDPWEGPAEWQNPHPAVTVSGAIAYVTEPAANAIHAVDLSSGEVVATGELDFTPNEIALAAG